jgi:serine protease AprX
MNTQKSKPWSIMWFNRLLFLFLYVFFFHYTFSQTNRYFVSFTDKQGTIYSIDNPLQFLSQKAIDRRSRQNVLVTEDDFPVNQNYVQGLNDIGAQVFFKSRWMNGVLVQCDESLVPDILALAFVSDVEMIAPGLRLQNGGRLSASEDGDAGTTTELQLNMIGLDSMHARGYAGEGVNIAVLDSGFPGVNTSEYFTELFADGRVNLSVSHDFVFNTDNVFQYDQHGAKVLSVLTAYKQGEFAGSARKANYFLFVTEDIDSEYRIEEYNWLFAAETADSAGVDIISSSLGYSTFDDPAMNYTRADVNGKTALISRAAQFAADRGILIVNAAGNEGSNSWGIVIPPADVEDVIAVANINSFGYRSASSSIGPTSDNRIKPDVAALGTNVTLVLPAGFLGQGSGTSYAAPLIAGLAAGLWQRYPNLTNRELMKAIKHTASQADQPDILLGWGVPNFVAVENYLDFKEQKIAFVIYPNPFRDMFSIRPKNPDEIASCFIEIHDVEGQMIERRSVSFNWLNPTCQVDLSTLRSGVYIVKITSQKDVAISKVVKR